MKENIVGFLFFMSLVSFCIEGSILITIIGFIIFCSCGMYIIRHQEDFLPKEESKNKVSKKKVESRYRNAA